MELSFKLYLVLKTQAVDGINLVFSLDRGGKSTHIFYLSRNTDTCLKKDSGKSRSADSTCVLNLKE